MEKLSPIGDEFYDMDLDNKIEVAIGINNPNVSYKYESKSYKTILNKLRQTHKDLYDACALMGKNLHSKKCTLDLHDGNIMKRGSTIVIIDPYAS